jgi:hypothetical protein
MILLAAFYIDSNANRQAEFLECLRRNAANEWIDEIHLFIESALPLNQVLAAHPTLANPKICLVPYGQRVTYHTLFTYANRNLASCRVVIANADIYFDHKLARLTDYELTGRLLCLSRWDVQPDGSAQFFDHPASQDAWVFQSPICEFPCDFPMGVPACDNRLAWEADHAGLALTNPSRSIPAYHLHLSLARHHSQRLRGPTKGVPASFLETPWLWLVIPCSGGLDALRQTAASVLAQPKSYYVLVDYVCPDAAGDWARAHHAEIHVVEVEATRRRGGAEARNRGAEVVDENGIIGFLGPDTGLVPGFSQHVLDHFEPDTFLVPDRRGAAYDSVLICSKAAFDRVGGFDECFSDWGEECLDLRAMLRRSGLNERTFPASLLAPLHPSKWEDAGFRIIRDAKLNRAIHAAYRRAKSAILDETGGNGISVETLGEIYLATMRHHLKICSSTQSSSCTTVAFRESMGYTIAQLEPGVSSHNNDSRPFVLIPEPLSGLQFTQVVASVVSPVKIEFLTSGKCYVLVGNDWDGYRVAREWLCKVGNRESLPLVETQRRTAFEVWSLNGEVGSRFVLPTQVMLVAEQLIRC